MTISINRILSYTKLLFQKKYFGFINGNDYLTKSNKKTIKKLIYSPDNEWISKYEKELSNSLGDGNVISYASGRMAFFSILKEIGIKENDEIILTGFTCSVMVNAIKKLKCIPVYSDIDINTLGSNPSEIEKLITQKTRLIVAQHSFGIPCEIDAIQKIARKRNIFLVEDCALSFLSRYKGITLGNWGDAAIFSTDHSKPLNTLIGGFAYTNNKDLYIRLKEKQQSLEQIPIKQQQNIYRQINFESKYFKPSMYRFLKLNQLTNAITKKIIKNSIQTFLDEDSDPEPRLNRTYPYPSPLPSFICYLGILELDRYKKAIDLKRNILNILISVISKKFNIPSAYSNPDNYIIPLRFVFNTESQTYRTKISGFIDKDWFWFKKPIEATSEDLALYGYKLGTCPIAERIGKTIINIPCIHKDNTIMIKYLKQL